MMLRIIHGKLKSGTWESYERAYKEATAKAGKIPGLKGRWLAHAVDDPDAGYTMSLWADEAAMRAYESGEALQQTICRTSSLFSRATTRQRGARFGLRKSSSNCER
jgi:heme-degrading monooxygenase HmoA